MKKVNYLLFIIFMLFSCVFYVDASCTNEEIELLKEEASKIKVTYKHLGMIKDDDGMIYYNRFDVNVKNVADDLYILYLDSIKLTPVDGLIKDVFVNGTYDFDIYSNKCDEKITTIEVYIPKFNVYSLESICQGIDTDDFPLCGKYYEYDVDYEDFVARVDYYRSTHNIDNKLTPAVEKSNDVFETIINLLLQYYFYIIMFVVFILLLIVVLLIIRKRNKRDVLK